MEGDERGFRIALVASELVNPNAHDGGFDALAILTEAGWGVIQLPAAWYPDEVAAPLLDQIAEEVDEFARHGYDVVRIGDRAGLAEALTNLNLPAPPAIAPATAGELHAFLASRPTVSPR
jgi:hypothetical protein